MANDPLDLWPDSIQVNPLTPAKILKLQADRLAERTQGLLTAEVVTRTEVVKEDDYVPSGEEVVYRFEIVVPRLNGARYQLFTCRHDSKLVYPVYIDEDDFHGLDPDDCEAASQHEFMKAVRELLSSKKIRGLISSLLARISEADTTATPA